MKNYRKLIVCLAAFAIAAFCDLNDSQAEVIIYIGIAFLTGNVIEHAKEMVTTMRSNSSTTSNTTMVPPVAGAGDKGDEV